MNINNKLNILAMSAKYDASCVSSGSTRNNNPGGIGTSVNSGICHSWAADGRCISLLKVLQTNNCVYDCAYCVNRSSNDIERALLSPQELADITINFYKRNYIEGLFLSSAVIRNPDYTMELMYRTVKLLRNKYHFNGYIHIKGMPGSDRRLIEKTGLLVDRMSINIELPSQKSLTYLAPQKNKGSIVSAMSSISNGIREHENSRGKHKKIFVPAGQSTQLIVGATPENDRTIMRLTEALYQRLSLKRVYYSAYVPVVSGDARLPVVDPPLRRENRLYQADWLLRFYGFSAGELLTEAHPNLDPHLDPKCFWALCNMHQFPVEINKADYEMLLRVPGIGVRSAKKIIRARRVARLTFDDLKKIGVVLKRARFFITCRDRHLVGKDLDTVFIRQGLINNGKIPAKQRDLLEGQQLLFGQSLLPGPDAVTSSISGEL